MSNVWFITGSQHLYGDDALRQVAADSAVIAEHLNGRIDAEVICTPVVTTASEITDVMRKANADDECIGVITWMHTFSPSKMWIDGLKTISKPILHFSTQFNEALPYSEIDMDFMNLNQSAHGDREHSHLYALMRKSRKEVVGHWQDEEAIEEIRTWVSAAKAFAAGSTLRVVRFGDNMRDVAVTDGNKVTAQAKLGWSVDYYGIGDLVEEIEKVTDEEAEALVEEYKSAYSVVTDDIAAIKEQAKYEIALERFLKNTESTAFTTNFQDLHGLKQLPGLSAQRLMAKGYGFGAEGDWKTAALTRAMKIMSENDSTAFMEDYTYNLTKGNEAILGAHMLEVCPTIAEGEIKLDVQPLGIGGKEPPARLIFNAKAGDAICVSLVDLGNRLRLICAEVECISTPEPMPKLPVASAMWKPYPDFKNGVKAWLLAGGAHHSVLSYSLTKEHIIDFARMAGIECVVIGKDTNVSDFELKLMLGDAAWK
ncbi:MAG: L-arabinose isomerase [Clostridia bacterium]|nr:L-arabinose isomerase [Clostridia bacterium]